MKNTILAIGLFVFLTASISLSADRYFISVKVLKTGQDSLLTDSIIKQIQAADSLMGEFWITNDKFIIIGRTTYEPDEDEKPFLDLKKIFPGIVIRKKKLEVIE